MRTSRWIRSLVIAVVMLGASAASFAQIGISIRIGPPALPVYEQPLCPGDGYIWTPGYWAYGPDGYFWVPGTWVLAPEPGYLWTPGYWAWGPGGFFVFHEGYWGLHVGFYGGINYGFGYFGNGYEGGRWDGGRFYYNRTVNNINVTNIHNVYNTTIINNNTTINRVSYNGGDGGVHAVATPLEEQAAREHHLAPVGAQTQHFEAARGNPQLRFSANQGKPPIAATARPAEFNHEAVPAKAPGASYSEGRGGNNVPRPPVPAEARDVQPHTNMPRPSTGNAKLDQKYQQQQDKLIAKQNQQHQQLQAKQEADHQRMQQKNYNDAQRQQVEQRHQQQTMRMETQHAQQQEHMASHQQGGRR